MSAEHDEFRIEGAGIVNGERPQSLALAFCKLGLDLIPPLLRLLQYLV